MVETLKGLVRNMRRSSSASKHDKVGKVFPPRCSFNLETKCKSIGVRAGLYDVCIKLPTSRTATVPVCHEQCADGHWCVVGRLLCQHSLLFTLNSLTQLFQHFRISSSIDSISLKQTFYDKWPLSVQENGCHNFWANVEVLNFLYWWWACGTIALIVGYF